MQDAKSKPPITCPFTVVIDGREKLHYRFTGFRADANKRNRPVVVPTQWAHLQTGDYSIAGCESRVCVERKSLDDLFGTLAGGRERFEREHQRMAAMQRAIVVIEASWFDVLRMPPRRSKLNPKTVFRTAMSWYVRYGVGWAMCEDRRLAEIFTFRFLEKFWKEYGDGEAES